MRMRPDVNALPWWKLSRAQVIEKDEGSDHLQSARRQHAAHNKTAEVSLA
jgi:hypothetical protein